MSQPLLQYREQAPPAELAAWVEAFWFIQTLATEPEQVQHWVLPEASLNLVLWAPEGWQRAESLYPPILSGPTVKAFRRPAIPGESYLGIRFLPGAGPAFVNRPGNKLTSLIQPLKLVLPEWSTGLAGKLRDVRSEAEAHAVVVEQLLQRTAQCQNADELMVQAAAWVRHQQEPVTLARWSSAFDLSERQFRRRFLLAVGLPPKVYLRIVRMQSFVRSHFLKPDICWGQVTYQAGYADQAHLVNDFRALSGDRPTRFYRHLKDIEHAMLIHQTSQHGRNLQYSPKQAG